MDPVDPTSFADGARVRSRSVASDVTLNFDVEDLLVRVERAQVARDVSLHQIERESGIGSTFLCRVRQGEKRGGRSWRGGKNVSTPMAEGFWHLARTSGSLGTHSRQNSRCSGQPKPGRFLRTGPQHWHGSRNGGRAGLLPVWAPAGALAGAAGAALSLGRVALQELVEGRSGEADARRTGTLWPAGGAW